MQCFDSVQQFGFFLMIFFGGVVGFGVGHRYGVKKMYDNIHEICEREERCRREREGWYGMNPGQLPPGFRWVPSSHDKEIEILRFGDDSLGAVSYHEETENYAAVSLTLSPWVIESHPTKEKAMERLAEAAIARFGWID
jgi:hypothetical protein